MVDIINETDLVSYLRVWDEDVNLALVVELANGLVSELYAERGREVPTTTRVRAITLEVAGRAYRNPNGYQSEQVDDYKYTRSSDSRSAGVYLTDAERSELLGIGITRPRGSFYTVGLASPLDIA